MRVGAFERQQDVGGDRHQFQADEQKHEVFGHRRQREPGQQDQKRACLFAGASGVDAAVSDASAKAGTTCHCAAEQVARLHEG